MQTTRLLHTGRRATIAGAMLALTLTSLSSSGQTTRTWSGGGENDYWSTGANWGGTAPVVGDSLVFGGANRKTNINDLDLTASPGIGPVTFSSANWHLSGNPIVKQINTGFTNSASGSTVVWDMDTTLGAANGTVWVRIPSGSSALIFPKVISGAASRHLRKEAGANAQGRLVLLNPANTFAGYAYLGSGPSEFVKIANAGQPSSLGAATSTTAASIIIGNTGTAYATDSKYIGTEDGETDRVINFQGRSTIAFNNNSPTNSLTFNGNWTFTPSTTPPRLILGGTSTGTNTVNGTLSQTTTTLPFGLDVNGPTTWVFNGANSLLGDVRFQSGTHYLGAGAAIAATNLIVAPGAVLDVSGMPAGYLIGSMGGQILKAGRTADPGIDIRGNLDLGYYGTLDIGGIGTPATLKISGNMKAASGVMPFDVSDQPGNAGQNDLLEVEGDLDLSGWTTLSVNPYRGGIATGTPYTLIKYAGSLIGNSTGIFVPPPARAFSATVSTDTTNEVRVTFSPSGQSAANLVWQGYPGYYWDVGISQSWLNGANEDKFQQLDAVTFNDNHTPPNPLYDVTLVSVVAPASITVDTTNTYTIGGNGSISGGAAMTITKKGTGGLKMLTANILAGPILLSAGTLLGGGSSALGSGDITIGDSATGTNDIYLLLNNAASIPCAIHVTTNGTGAVVLGRESGGAVTFRGPLTLSRDLILTNPGPFAAGNRVYVSGLISGEGNLTADGGGYITLNPATTNTFVGDVKVRGDGTVFQVDSGRGLPPTCNVDVGPGANFQPYGSLAINSLTGSGMLRGVSGTYTLTVGAANGDSLFTGQIVHNTQGGTDGILNLRKAGSGRLTLTGDSSGSYGGTTVAEGVLAVNNETGSGLGSGSVLVEAAGTLAGNGSINISNHNATIQGKLSVGNPDDTAGQSFTVTTEGALVINGGTLEVDLFSGAGAGDNTANAAAADVLVAEGAVSLQGGATLVVGNPKGLTGWALGDKWKIINWSTPPTGTFSTVTLPPLTAGLGWDLSELYVNGTIAVGSAPVQPQIAFEFDGTRLTLTWAGGGILQSAPEVTGEYADIPGATSPYVITDFSAPRAFYRVRMP